MPSDPTAPRQHAATSSTSVQPAEPKHAERVKTMLSLAGVAVLSTVSRKHPGFPFGSLMPFALDDHGRPLFLISNMAMHTQNLRTDPRASLFTGPSNQDVDPLGAARATLVGQALPVPQDDLAIIREKYLGRHESSRYWVDFADFHFFRLEVVEAYYVGGFGVMGWVTAEDYLSAAVDPLASAAAGILSHMNADHVDAMILLAKVHLQLQASEAAITSVDRLGFTLKLRTSDGIKGGRVNFLQPVSSPEETRTAMVSLVRAAKQN